MVAESAIEAELPSARIFLYEKSPAPNATARAAAAAAACAGLSARARCVALPNVGLEAHAYLSHILRQWNDLAPKTVFTQAGAPTPGYRGHDAGYGGHLMPADDFLYDYVRPSAPPRLVPTTARVDELLLRFST